MIQCDTCLEWYHAECVKYTKVELAQLEMYTCQACEGNVTLWHCLTNSLLDIQRTTQSGEQVNNEHSPPAQVALLYCFALAHYL